MPLSSALSTEKRPCRKKKQCGSGRLLRGRVGVPPTLGMSKSWREWIGGVAGPTAAAAVLGPDNSDAPSDDAVTDDVSFGELKERIERIYHLRNRAKLQDATFLPWACIPPACLPASRSRPCPHSPRSPALTASLLPRTSLCAKPALQTLACNNLMSPLSQHAPRPPAHAPPAKITASCV